MGGLRVFVTRELYPFTAGGIGRVIANILDLPEFRAVGTDGETPSVAVVFLGEPLDQDRFRSRFPNVLLVDASPQTYVEFDEVDKCRYVPADQYTTHRLHAESVRAMQALKRLERSNGFLSYIEFPDWGGSAFASLAERRLGKAFVGSTIAIRLHTCDSVLSAVESTHVDRTSLVLYDIERKALSECDLLIGQTAGSARVMQSILDFSDAEWDGRLYIDAPPVVPDCGLAVQHSIVPDHETPIVFSSKIQRIKRPDVFIKGCCDFLVESRRYFGKVYILASVADVDYLAELRALIPEELTDRFLFISDATKEVRFDVIRRSVCIFPGNFESFCLAAYEAALSGAICVLNELNPAFGDESPWRNGLNCIKFDGSSADLANQLRSLFDSPRAIEAVSLPSGARPWHNLRTFHPNEAREAQDHESQPLVSVLVPHYNLGGYIEETVDNVLGANYPKLEVLIVDDASTEPDALAALERIAARNDPRIRIVKSSRNRGLAATRNAAVRSARGAFFLTLDADDLIAPDFIAIAVKGLLRNPEVAFAVPQAAYFDDGADGEPGSLEWARCLTFVGEARASGIVQNYFSTATVLGRAEAFRIFKYDECLRAYEDWDMYMRALMSGARFMVTNSVHFYYRRRGNSMIHDPQATRRLGYYYHDIIRSKFIGIGNYRLPLYIVAACTDLPHGQSGEVLRARLASYENSTAVAVALAVRQKMDRLPTILKRAAIRLLRALK
ncbi:glycosyl transferase [Burkholderia multivorans]|uniref:glycosyltransferase family 2 protein n=1 Tax=Burkholderia multivorans TaxID=87883 RepID=UPI000CFF3296|nr:glycosyltransferase [Burkholderia multivorans]PRG13047.1 glycosyl transferase [Burkholderia multivorans]